MATTVKTADKKAQDLQAGAGTQADPTIADVTMTHDKDTKNSVRYQEDGDEATHKIGQLYVKKSAFPNGAPEQIRVILETA